MKLNKLLIISIILSENRKSYLRNYQLSIVAVTNYHIIIGLH